MDVSILATFIPRSLAAAIPEPVLYQHGQVGECNDLIFGFSLLDYANAKNLQENEIPRIVRICIKEIDQRGLECEGIYRVSLCLVFLYNTQHISRYLVVILLYRL